VRRVGAREVGGHLGARHVDQQLTTTLDVQTPSHVRGDVVLRTDRATALYNLTTTRCATRQPAVQRAVKRTLIQPAAHTLIFVIPQDATEGEKIKIKSESFLNFSQTHHIVHM